MSGYALWNPATVYLINDIVDYDAVIYISIQGGNVNRQPNINPTFWATIGGGSGISSIVAGTGISVAGSTSITITNTGIRTLTAGTGMTVGGTANDATVVNNGIRTLTAGTGMTVGGTANDATVVNNGVRTITAGTGIQLGGTANDVIINATTLATRPIRNLTPFNFSFNNPGSPIVLNNSTLAAGNVGSILLNPLYGSSFNFTFYIGNIEAAASTTNASSLNYIIYPATHPTQQFNGDDAMSSTTFSATPGIPTQSSQINQIWNWNGSLTGNLLYINVAPVITTPFTTTSVEFVDITFDLMGMTIESV